MPRPKTLTALIRLAAPLPKGQAILATVSKLGGAFGHTDEYRSPDTQALERTAKDIYKSLVKLQGGISLVEETLGKGDPMRGDLLKALDFAFEAMNNTSRALQILKRW
jgi:hypothetical protein